MGEFCAHEDEENQSQELARRLHLSPPVCADQRSHMQIGSRTALLSSRLSSRVSLLLGCTVVMWSLSSPAAVSCACSGLLGASLRRLTPPLRSARPHLLVAATVRAAHRSRDAQTRRRNLRSEVAKTLPPRLKQPCKLSVEKTRVTALCIVLKAEVASRWAGDLKAASAQDGKDCCWCLIKKILSTAMFLIGFEFAFNQNNSFNDTSVKLGHLIYRGVMIHSTSHNLIYSI